jgi:thiamine biosynthesis protein ThiS
MEITVNGEKLKYEGPSTIVGLLQSLGINPKAVAIERNLQIIMSDGIEAAELQDGDCLEIMRMVGGG